MEKKRILVVCGTGIATSTVVAKNIEEKLKEKGFSVETRQCKATEIKNNLDGVDLIVTTTNLSGDFGIPVIRSLAFLTGIGEEEAIEEIANKLKES